MRARPPHHGSGALRDGATASRVALLAASGLHLGFQSVVTTVVYPELFGGTPRDVPGRQPAHVRAIAPLAGVVYTALGAAAGWAAVSSIRSPGGGRTATALSCTAAALAPAITAAVAIPLQLGVSRGRVSRKRLEAIRVADRVRTGAAAVGVAAAARALIH